MYTINNNVGQAQVFIVQIPHIYCISNLRDKFLYNW